MKTQGSLVACGDRLALDKPSIIVIEAEVSRPTVKTPSSWVPTQELEKFCLLAQLRSHTTSPTSLNSSHNNGGAEFFFFSTFRFRRRI